MGCGVILESEGGWFNPFHPIVAFHIETSLLFFQRKTNYWFLNETQHWAEKANKKFIRSKLSNKKY